MPESLRGRRRNEEEKKKKKKRQKYGFKFRETCMGESGTDKLPEIAILRNQSKYKWIVFMKENGYYIAVILKQL